MATPIQLKNGLWRIRVGTGTDRTYFTAKTKREALAKAAEYMAGIRQKASRKTVGDALDEYLTVKQAVISPSTYRGYLTLRRNAYITLENTDVDLLDTRALQRWVSAYARQYSPKGVRNATSLLLSAVALYRPDAAFHLTLPQAKRPDLHTPDSSDISRLLDHVRAQGEPGKELLSAILLGAFGPLRRGEICALLGSDLDHEACTVSVTKSMVETSEGGWIVKQPKTSSSYRKITMPAAIMAEIPQVAKQERLIKAQPNQITDRFKRAVKATKITPIRFHDLRHYGASILHAWGLPDQYIMQRGGWQSDYVMKRVYRDTIDEETARMDAIIAEKVKGIV